MSVVAGAGMFLGNVNGECRPERPQTVTANDRPTTPDNMMALRNVISGKGGQSHGFNGTSERLRLSR